MSHRSTAPSDVPPYSTGGSCEDDIKTLLDHFSYDDGDRLSRGEVDLGQSLCLRTAQAIMELAKVYQGQVENMGVSLRH